MAMTVPNLPTDNLYKFGALVGLAWSLIAFFFPDYRSAVYDERLYQHELERARTDYLIDSLEWEMHKDSLEMVDRPRDPAILDRQIYRAHRLSHLGQLNLARTNALVRITKREGKIAEISDSTFLWGYGLMVVGFFLWYLQLQRFQDAIVRAEARSRAPYLRKAASSRVKKVPKYLRWRAKWRPGPIAAKPWGTRTAEPKA